MVSEVLNAFVKGATPVSDGLMGCSTDVSVPIISYERQQTVIRSAQIVSFCLGQRGMSNSGKCNTGAHFLNKSRTGDMSQGRLGQHQS